MSDVTPNGSGNGAVPQLPSVSPTAGSPGTDFVAFAVGAGANVASQASYLADPQTQTGNLPGMARSNFVNKTLRQGAFVASGVSTFITEELQEYVSDDGDVPKWVGQFREALRVLFFGLLPAGPDLGLYLPIAGGTMQGNIQFAGSATTVLSNNVFARGKDTGGTPHGMIKVDDTNNITINDGFATYVNFNGYPVVNNNWGYAMRDTSGGVRNILRLANDNSLYLTSMNAIYLQTTGGLGIYLNSHVFLPNSNWIMWNQANGVAYTIFTLDANNNFVQYSPGDIYIVPGSDRTIVLFGRTSFQGEAYFQNIAHFNLSAYINGLLWVNSSLQVNGASNFYAHVNINNSVGLTVTGNLDCNYLRCWGSSAQVDGNLYVNNQFNSNTVYTNYMYSYGDGYTVNQHYATYFFAFDHFWTYGYLYGSTTFTDNISGTANNTPICQRGLAIYPIPGNYTALNVEAASYLNGGVSIIGDVYIGYWGDWYNVWGPHYGNVVIGFDETIYHGSYWGAWPDWYCIVESGLGYTTTVGYVQPPRMSISHGGWASKPGGGMWWDSCDERVKKDVTRFERGLAEVIKLNPVNYRYNGLGETTEDSNIYQGVTAQETMRVFPEMVKRHPGRVKLNKDDEDYLDEYFLVDSTPLVFALVNAVKELSARLTALEGK